MCMCVEKMYGGYPNSTMLLESCLSCLKLENTFTREHGLSFSFLSFFHGRHMSTHCFRYLRHLSIFSILFYFCIATCLFLQIGKLSRKTFTRTWSIYSKQTSFVSSPSVGVKHFGWMENMLLHTPSVGVADICGVYVILILRA
jgi:hypothetical protein